MGDLHHFTADLRRNGMITGDERALEAATNGTGHAAHFRHQNRAREFATGTAKLIFRRTAQFVSTWDPQQVVGGMLSPATSRFMLWPDLLKRIV